MPGFLVAILFASYGPTLQMLAQRWAVDARYSHGFLVPLFALYLLWARRALLANCRGGSELAGLGLVALGVVLRLAGAHYFVNWVEEISLLPSIAGVVLILGGRVALRWAAPSILFLSFMVPLPYRVERSFGLPLQGVATAASTYLLQTIGLAAVSEGNIIYLDHARIGVVEACNGLGMLVMFFAFTAGAVLLMRRHPLENTLIVLSAIPIALVANVLRITITGVLHEMVNSSAANTFYHSVAGWVMMPLAIGALQLELILMSRLFPQPENTDGAHLRPESKLNPNPTPRLQT
jgi:exosortase